MRTVLILLVAVAWPSALLAQPYVVRDNVGGCLNVRPTPDTSTDPIACLPAGTQVTVVGSIPYWREITFGTNERGWAAKKYLEPVAGPPPADPADAIPADAFLQIHFVDVGQGDAIWIQTYDDGIDGNGRFEGYNIIIDGGPYASDNSNPLLPYMEARTHHGDDVEAMIITHPHTDHFRGAETISRHFDVQHYYDPGFPSTLQSYQAFLAAMQGTAGAPPRAHHVHIGSDNFGIMNWGSELTVEVLYSWAADQAGLGSGNTAVNNASIVLRIEYGDHAFLFMGDAEGKDRNDDPTVAQYVENFLLQQVPQRLPSTVLKVGHHGSETSSTIPFIQAVDPSIVIVQSGRRSFNGTFIPDASALQRYCAHNPNVRICRTDQNDEADNLSSSESPDADHIVIRTNGSGQPQVEALSGGQPFVVNSCGN